MKGLRLAGPILAILLLTGPAGAAHAQRATAKRTGAPIWTLALDGSRVAYASGGRIHVWNMATGATSVIGGKYGNAKHAVNASQVAIAGKRVAWIKDQQFGNTEEDEKLYTAPVGGTAHELEHVHRFGRDDPSQTTGGWIDGLVGFGTNLVVSTWKSNGTTATDEQLSRIAGSGLRPLAGGVGAIVSQAGDSGHIAVLNSSPWSTSTGASVYSVNGKLLAQVPLGTAGKVALTGNQLIALTPAPTPALEIYDWTTGTLEHAWPALGAATSTAGPHQVGHVAAYGGLVLYSVFSRYVGGNETLHALDPATGKDVVVGTARGFDSNRDWAVGSRGLVYAVNSSRQGAGKLVFVPTAKLLAAVGR